jgi:hypothetical protein
MFEFSYCRMYIFAVGYDVDMFSILMVFQVFLIFFFFFFFFFVFCMCLWLPMKERTFVVLFLVGSLGIFKENLWFACSVSLWQ